jgi:osmoprotectant transport system permease protein
VDEGEDRAVNYLVSWLGDSANWTGPSGVPTRVLEHLEYTGIALVFALIIGLPLGALVGHTGRGGLLLVGAANALRALPTLGVLTLVVLVIGLGLAPPMVALIVLAIPPVMAGAYAGIQAVDPEVVDAARGIGMREDQVLLRVEIPNALPLILGGVRSATLQLIATATIAAYVALGGLGRFIIDGNNQLDYPQMASGAVLVAVLAILIDTLLAGVQRVIVSPGLRSRHRSG